MAATKRSPVNAGRCEGALAADGAAFGGLRLLAVIVPQ
jgi:hypothetical protein